MKTGHTKVKLYQQSSLSEARSLVSFGIGSDVMLYAEICDAFSWVDPLVILNPILISFLALPQSWGTLSSASSLSQFHSFSK